MKKCLKIVMVFILLIEGLFEKNEPYVFVEEPQISVSSCIVSDGITRKECWFEADIYGAIQNTSNEEWERVSIVFIVFDLNGEEIGEATTKMIHVEQGEIWYFCAPLQGDPPTKPKSFTLKKVIINE